ncbi:MAG: LamG domain-containing protein [Candidatus Altiarchaeota archaeon]|nr:LamG domain-containing protein [Candidatus Altiarchaeota archaeon]
MSGKALRFDGSGDYVMLQDYPEMKLHQNLTLAFWMYPEAVGNTRQNLLDKSYGGEFALTLEDGINGVGKMSYFHGTAESGGNYWGWDAFDTGNFTNNTWYFVVITRSNTTNVMKSYKNGELMASTTYSLSNAQIPTQSTDPVMIGQGYTGAAFNGVIDEVRIYNRTLSQDEVMILYRSYPEYYQSDLMGYWPMDTGSGTTVVDATPYGTDGTFYSDPTWTSDSIYGNAIDFDGDSSPDGDYITFASNPAMFDVDVGEAHSFSAWVKAGAQASTGFFFWKEGGCIGWELYMETDGDIGCLLRTGDAGCTGYNNYTSVSSGLDYSDGKWHQVICSIDRPNLNQSLYVDGHLVASVAIDNTFSGVGGSLRIGTQWNNANPFDGIIDEVRAYDKALAPSEIAYIYQQEKWRKYACDAGTSVACSGGTCENKSSLGSYYYCYDDSFQKYNLVQDECQDACEAYNGLWRGNGGNENCCSPIESNEVWCDGTGSICNAGIYSSCDEWCDVYGGTIGSYTCTSDRDYDCSVIGNCASGVCPCALASTKQCTDESQCGAGNCTNFGNDPVTAALGSWGTTPSDIEKICCEEWSCVYDSNGDGYIESCAANATNTLDVDSDGDTDVCYEGTWYECLDFTAENQLASDCDCSLGSVAVDDGTWACRVSPVNTGSHPCGTSCDSDSSQGTEEMIDKVGVCSIFPNICADAWHTATWEGDTNTLDLRVNMTCPCNSVVNCDVVIDGDSGIRYSNNSFTATSNIFDHEYLFPDLGYNYNNITVNCSCTGIGQECKRELSPIFVLFDESISREMCIAGQSCLTSVSIENIGTITTGYDLTINSTVQSDKIFNTSGGYVTVGTTETVEFYNSRVCSDFIQTWVSASNYTTISYDYALELTNNSYTKRGTSSGWLAQCDDTSDCASCYSSEGDYWAFGDASNFSCSENVCCGVGEIFLNGACCPEGEQCCLGDSSCDLEEWCDNYTSSGGYLGQHYEGVHFCRDAKADGLLCEESRECLNNWCGGGICADSNPVPLTEWFECDPQGGGVLCGYENIGAGPQGCNGDSYCSNGYYCYTPRHACLDCPDATSEYGGINMSNDGLCPSSNCVGYDSDCCVVDADCSNINWCDATSTCRTCSTRKDVICSSSNCISIDPDCCSIDNDCATGEVCSGGTCIGNVGEDCTSDVDCTSGLVCRGAVCVSENFMTIVPEAPGSGYYNATVGDILKYTVLVANPQLQEDFFTVRISTSAGHDSAFARLDNEMSKTFRLGSGSTEKLLLTVFAGRQALAPSDALTIILKVNSTSNTLVGDSIELKVDVRSKLGEGMPRAPGVPALAVLLLGLLVGLITLR